MSDPVQIASRRALEGRASRVSRPMNAALLACLGALVAVALVAPVARGQEALDPASPPTTAAPAGSPRGQSEGGASTAGESSPAAAGGTSEPAAGAAGESDSAESSAPFGVWEYRVLGSKVLDQRSVERAVYPYLGPHRTIADVQAARAALEAAYRAAGYNTVYVDVPEQTVDQGIVRLSVTEGRLDRVRVTGARYFSNHQILAALPALKSGEVPHFPDVQQELTDLNRRTRDRAVTPVLRAGRYPGTVDVELRVKDDLPLHGGFEVNNRYTADTTKLRSNLSLSYDNLWQHAHTASLQYQVAPQAPDEAKVIAGTYVARLQRVNKILAFYGVDSKSDVATVGTLSVIGKGKLFGVRGILPFDAIGHYSHNLTLGLDAKHFDEDIRLTEQDQVSTPIKYVNWSAIYSFGWALPKSTSQFTIGADWGLRGFGNDDYEFEQKRFKARANYVYLLGTAEHSRQVLGQARFLTRLNWQYTNMPLINNEQFSAGGVASVRGYLEAEELSDYGASLSLELQTPSLVKAARVDDLRVFGFVDVGSGGIVDALPSQPARFRLSSAGTGLRFSGLGGMQVELDWARPMRDGTHVLKNEDRLDFRLSYGF
jgi:hemolysin activation/secretion protein